MRNYNHSDYAINKCSKGIVYQFADGIAEITLEDYLRDNPHKTESDFNKIKALSDEIYHQQARQEHKTNRLNVSIHNLEETSLLPVVSIETELIQQEDERKALRAASQLLHSGKLTEIQKRRFQQHYFQGLSIRQIARLEGVHQRAVWDSLMWAEKKFKKFFDQ